MSKSSLNKKERIKSRKLISTLFSSGKKLRQGPLLLIWDIVEPAQATADVMFGVSVSKRSFKRAVDRNLIKRNIREAFRLQKIELINSLEKDHNAYGLFVVYVGREIGDYHEMDRSMRRLLTKWKNARPETTIN